MYKIKWSKFLAKYQYVNLEIDIKMWYILTYLTAFIALEEDITSSLLLMSRLNLLQKDKHKYKCKLSHQLLNCTLKVYNSSNTSTQLPTVSCLWKLLSTFYNTVKQLQRISSHETNIDWPLDPHKYFSYFETNSELTSVSLKKIGMFYCKL